MTAAPAHAAPSKQCKTSFKSFALPGKPDVRVSATICIQRYRVSGPYRYYKAWLHKVSWDGTSGWFIGGKRFHELSFSVRAEHGRTSIANCSHGGICEVNHLSSSVNARERGSKTHPSGAGGYGIAWVKTKKANWTGDATATYDIADDGRPGKQWELAGTSAVR
ncbi:hypothetical protein ACWF94_30720 [Streptomyces sp. NPDC055078]